MPGQSGGAAMVAGGQPLDRKGFFFAPTIVPDITPTCA